MKTENNKTHKVGDCRIMTDGTQFTIERLFKYRNWFGGSNTVWDGDRIAYETKEEAVECLKYRKQHGCRKPTWWEVPLD